MLADVPLGFPALTRALKLQKRAARVGFDWGAAEPILAKIGRRSASWRAAVAEGAALAERELELGDLLFTVVNLARHLEHRSRERATRHQRQVRAPVQVDGGPRTVPWPGAADAWSRSAECLVECGEGGRRRG